MRMIVLYAADRKKADGRTEGEERRRRWECCENESPIS